MRIDTLIGQLEFENRYVGGVPQDSFGQTMLALERDMWPGARAGSTGIGSMPKDAAAKAESSLSHGSTLAAQPGRGGGTGKGSHNTSSPAADENPQLLLQTESPAVRGMPLRPRADLTGVNTYLAPLKNPASSEEPETETVHALGYPRKQSQADAATTDQVTLTGDATDAAVVLRFEAPLRLRKALSDAVAAELKKRGLPLRAIVINGIQAESTGDTP